MSKDKVATKGEKKRAEYTEEWHRHQTASKNPQVKKEEQKQNH